MNNYDCPNVCDLVTNCFDCSRYGNDCDKESKIELLDDICDVYYDEETKTTIYEVRKNGTRRTD